jgi:hypothetical protein
MRDAVIWLSFLDYCTERLKTYRGYHVAFISENVRDFANSNRDKFHPRLQEDVEATNAVIDYYPSLDLFIERQAKPISHVTVEWVTQRIDLGDIQSMIENHLVRSHYSWQRMAPYFLVSNDRLRKLYVPSGTPQVYQLVANLEGVKVYQFDDTHIEASLEFYVYAEADIDCQLAESVIHYSFIESALEKEDLLSERTLSCIADLRVFVSAIIKDDTVEILEIEDVLNENG